VATARKARDAAYNDAPLDGIVPWGAGSRALGPRAARRGARHG